MIVPEEPQDVTIMKDWQIQDFAKTFGFDADRVDRVLVIPIGEEDHRVQFALTFVFKSTKIDT